MSRQKDNPKNHADKTKTTLTRRLFLAFNLPEEVSAGLSAFSRSLAAGCPRGSATAVPKNNMHITVHFLGEVGAERETALRKGLEAITACFDPLRFRTGCILFFPTPEAPRVIALQCLAEDKGAAVSLASRSGSLIADTGIDVDNHPWLPHITVLRFRPGYGRGGYAGAASGLAGDSRPALNFGLDWRPEYRESFFPTPTLDLMLSEPGPAGVRYTVLERFPLRGCAPISGNP